MGELVVHPLLHILALALIHSLWSMALLISVTYLIGRTVRHAAVRYRLYLGCLLLLPLVFLAILLSFDPVSVFQTVGQSAQQSSRTLIEPPPWLPRIAVDAIADPAPFGWLPYLGIAYLFGLSVSSAVSGYHYVRGRRVRQATLLPPPAYRQQFVALRDRVARGISVQWSISSSISTVVVVGFLRPLILFPVGLLNQLSQAEVEAILLHELAHLRRNDHRWVVVQRFVCDLFFYHPLVYWLSRQINLERECACDDWVVGALAQDRSVYAQALLKVARHTDSLHPSISRPMPLSATATALRYRLRRLFLPPTVRSGRGNRYPYLLVLLLVAGGWIVAHAQSGPPDATPPADVATQPTDNVFGRVLDAATLKPLIGTTVVATVGEETLGTVTDFGGYYAFALPAGPREITFFYTGYDRTRRTVVVGDTTQVDVLLPRDGARPSEKGDQATDVTVPGSKKAENILYVIDGERVEKRGVNELDPSTIAKVNVIRGEAEVAALGFGSEYDGAVVVTLKE